ncbi:hypothetical protein [Herbidospora mongoliensis]|uniref:hypothetical protein n=1 Tax=Herbidospora mongoliensis TaxID=688067 RepID=UPI0008297833|nr:hypothetical protein [Herbidospora mongoliensis]
MKRTTRLLAALIMGIGMAVHVVAPAQAGVFDGDVTNWLPSNYTVKIATFSGPNRTERCAATNGTTYSCRTFWLPYGKADDQINGQNWDTDALMVESSYRIYGINGSYQTVAAFRWYKISSGDNRTCEMAGSAPACYYR